MRVLSTGIVALMLAALCSCQTSSVPAVSPAVAAAGKAKGASFSSLQNGRAVLTTRCIACHGVQPIGKYPLGEWKTIVGSMSKRAHLNNVQEQDLLAYISAAHDGGH